MTPAGPSLFDAATPAPRRAMDGAPIFTVSEITHRIRETLEQRIGSIWVTGELTGVRIPASGHCYFTLKDAEAQIAAVIWRTAFAARGRTFPPLDRGGSGVRAPLGLCAPSASEGAGRKPGGLAAQ